MRVLKPQRLSFLHRTFARGGEHHLALTVIAGFDFAASAHLLPEVVVWKTAAEHLSEGAVLDEGMPKTRGEILVSGFAFSDDAPSVDCRITVGALQKTVRVFGDRFWDQGRISEPQPFARMPVDHAHAFGGEGFPLNPDGRGFGYPDDVRLPNVEDPRQLISGPDDRPPPAGFEAYPVTWPQRAGLQGTYDDAWLKNDFPGYPRDHDWDFFSCAPIDQRIDGFFAGDEEVTVTHMHPEQPHQRTHLPGVIARCFVERAAPEPAEAEEVAMRLDSVRLYPHVGRGIVIFRGTLVVEEHDARDIARILVAADRMGAERTAEHFVAVLDRRRDLEQAALEALDDRDLLPPDGPVGVDHTVETDHGAFVVPHEGLLAANMRRRAEGELEQLRDRLRENDVETSALPDALPVADPEPTLSELPEWIARERQRADEARVSAEQRMGEVEKQQRAVCQAQGLDYDALRAAASTSGGGPPPSVADAVERMRDRAQLLENAGVEVGPVRAMLDDPATVAQLERADAAQREGYRRMVHHLPAAPDTAADVRRQLRDEVVARRESQRSCAGLDLTGADLSGLDLHDMCFDDALMERVDLSRSDVTRCSFVRTVLARGTLTDTSAAKADMTDANLGHADLSGCRLDESVLVGATLTGARATGTSFRSAALAKADLSELKVDDTSFDDIDADGVRFIQCRLRGASFARAKLSAAVFVECDLDGVDLSHADLSEATLVTSTARRASMAAARLGNLRVVASSDLSGIDLRGAALAGANFRGTTMPHAKLNGADLSGADLSECDLDGADLSAVMARESRFERTSLREATMAEADLLGALLTHADVRGADLRGANLFRCDFAHATGDDKTRFDGANTGFVRVIGGGSHVPG